jgi:hypothetical protein
MLKSRWKSSTRDELVIEVWEALDCESVGAHELEQIEEALQQQLGAAVLVSPASIARTVADEGAVLRHPEVFDCDLRWREKHLAQEALTSDAEFFSLKSALESFAKLEAKRVELQTSGDKIGEKQLREFVMGARKDSLLRARSKIIEEGEREQAIEISEWLKVWLQAPELFRDWLELRMRAPDFRKKFTD